LDAKYLEHLEHLYHVKKIEKKRFNTQEIYSGSIL